jgi:hypothetical protein
VEPRKEEEYLRSEALGALKSGFYQRAIGPKEQQNTKFSGYTHIS